MKRNRIRIWGRKVTTAPTPAIAPSTTAERSSPGGSGARGRLRQPGDAVLDPRYRRLAPGEHRLKHYEHDRGEDERAEHGVKEHCVQPVRPAAHGGFADHCSRRDLARPALQVDE